MTAAMEGQVGTQFGLTVRELRELMEHRSHEGLELINSKHGGVLEICKKLKTSPTEGMYSCIRMSVSLALSHWQYIIYRADLLFYLSSCQRIYTYI